MREQASQHRTGDGRSLSPEAKEREDCSLEVINALGQTRKASIGVSDNTYPIIDPRTLEGKMAQFMDINLKHITCNLCDRVEMMRRMLKVTNAVSEHYTRKWPDEPGCKFAPDVSIAEIRTHAGNRMKITHVMAIRKAILVEEIAKLENHKCGISMRFLENMTVWTEEGNTPMVTIATALPPMIHEILEFPGIQRTSHAKQTCISRDGKLYIDVANVKNRVMQEVGLAERREKQLGGIRNEGVDLDQEPGYVYGAMGSAQRGIYVKPTEAPHAGTNYKGMSREEWMVRLSGAVAEFAHTGHEEMRKPENQIRFLGKLSYHLRQGERRWIWLSPWSQARLPLHAAGYVDMEYMMGLIGTYLKMAKVDARDLCIDNLARILAFIMQEIPLTRLNVGGSMDCDPEKYSWRSTEVPQVLMAAEAKKEKDFDSKAGTTQIKINLLGESSAPSRNQTNGRRNTDVKNTVTVKLQSAGRQPWRERKIKDEERIKLEQTQPNLCGSLEIQAEGESAREVRYTPACGARAARIRRVREEYENQRRASERRVKQIQEECNAIERKLAAIGGALGRGIGARGRQNHTGFPRMAWSGVIRNLRRNELEYHNNPGRSTQRPFLSNIRRQESNLSSMPFSFKNRHG